MRFSAVPPGLSAYCASLLPRCIGRARPARRRMLARWKRLACSRGLAPAARSLHGSIAAPPRSSLCAYYTRVSPVWQAPAGFRRVQAIKNSSYVPLRSPRSPPGCSLALASLIEYGALGFPPNPAKGFTLGTRQGIASLDPFPLRRGAWGHQKFQRCAVALASSPFGLFARFGILD